MSERSNNAGRERVWDPLVRLTHWVIALAVILNGLVVEEDALAHIWIGYVALALLLLRLFWGLIGSESARFSAFPPSVRGAIQHIKVMFSGKHPDYPSHNPLGAWMAYALWALLLFVSATGLMLDSQPFPQVEAEYSTEYDYNEDKDDDNERAEALEELHEGAANLLLLLAVLHVGGVLLESRLSGRNLARAMISGRRT